MYLLNPRLAADVFDGEYIIANLDTGLYYSLQGLAVTMLASLPFTDHKAVIQSLADSFPEQSVEIVAELTSVLKELVDEEIILKNDDASPSSADPQVAPNEYTPSRFNRYADMQDLLLLDPIHDVNEEGWTVQEDKK